MPSPLSASEVRDLLVEQLDALLADCNLVADNAQHGQTLNDLEAFFLDRGRKFIHDAFQLKLQEHIEKTEDSDESKQCGQCKKKHESATATRKR